MVKSLDWFAPFQDGEEFAFRQVFDSYYRPVHYFALKILKEDLYVDDIVSETFNKAWNARAKFNTQRHLENFLYLVTRNACINHLRVEKVYKATDEEWIDLAAGDPQVHDPRDAERVQARFLEKIYNEMAALPDRGILRMYYIEGKSIKEIAEELNITENNVSLLKGRNLKRLRSMLTPEELLFFAYVFLRWLN